MIDALILGSIGIYQRYISPRKGWRCAYSVLHGGTGCSGYVKTEIREHGWRAARRAARKRFHECKLAGQALRAQATPGAVYMSAAASRRRRKDKSAAGGWCDPECCDPSGCKLLDALFDCGPGDSGCIDCSHPCDCTPCD
ncbi:membrane protein insertion efficiency factor YidD [bacterium]|nr:MAG: membrane protein insertion efficiency factor YidD [bacterium]